MSAQELIQSVDQLKVWGNIVGCDRLGVRFLRPAWMGKDKTPDCKLSIKGDKIRFSDPARGIFWDIIEGYKNLFPHDGFNEMAEKMLSWSGGSVPTSTLIGKGELYQPNFVLTPKVIEWTEWGIDYWAKRGITVDKLSNPKCLTQEICAHEISGTNEQGDYYSLQYGQGFVYWCNGRPKCYYPFAPKEKKFKGRLRANDCWVLNRGAYRDLKGLPDTKTLLISKSNKDTLCWTNFVACDLMAIAAEGTFPDSDWLMTNVRMRYERVIVVFDPDPAGIRGANELQNRLLSLSDIGTFVVKVWCWPDPVAKDLDKYLVENGHEATQRFLIANNFHKIFT